LIEETKVLIFFLGGNSAQAIFQSVLTLDFAVKFIFSAMNKISSFPPRFLYQNVDYVILTKMQITGKHLSEANFSTKVIKVIYQEN